MLVFSVFKSKASFFANSRQIYESTNERTLQAISKSNLRPRGSDFWRRAIETRSIQAAGSDSANFEPDRNFGLRSGQ